MIRIAFALAALAAAALAAAAPAAAQERPREEELFGAPAQPAPSAPPRESAPSAPASAAGEGSRERGIISKEKEDPLRLGGQLYLRAQLAAQEDTSPGDWLLSSPNLLDVFLDARPNDRVRAFVLGRLSYDPTREDAKDPFAGLPPAIVDALGLGLPANPDAALDQLWVNFDLGRRVFVTAGKQHVKWGVGRLWNPTDFLHREPRDPLDPFDARTGVTMVKAHVPWEARGWNAYAVALLEDPRHGGGDRAGTLGGVPAGGRAEIVLGTVELGADVLAGGGARPRYGLDVSAGVWELDLHAGVALGGARARWREVDASLPPFAGQRYELEPPSGLSPRVVAGGSWSAMYSDEDAVTLGAEYFYQEDGYEDPQVYPFLFFGAPALGGTAGVERRDPGAFTSFYLGRHYAGAFVLLQAPGSWNDTTFTLSALGNVSDKSGVIRLDHSVLLLTYLRLETFVQGHVGSRGTEFRFAFDVPPEVAGPLGSGPVGTEPPLVDVGIALRVSL